LIALIINAHSFMGLPPVGCLRPDKNPGETSRNRIAAGDPKTHINPENKTR
jgi:hypothetical protein